MVCLQLEEELQNLLREEEKLDQELTLLSTQESQASADLQALSTQKTSLKQEEETFWLEVNSFERNLFHFQDSLSAVNE